MIELDSDLEGVKLSVHFARQYHFRWFNPAKDRGTDIRCTVSVSEEDGLLAIESSTEDHLCVTQQLLNEELVTWKQVGPNDSELYATEKLRDLYPFPVATAG